MTPNKRLSGLTRRTLQGWSAFTLIAIGFALASPSGLFGDNLPLALAWILGGWFIHTLRLGYVMMFPQAPDRLVVAIGVMGIWLVGAGTLITSAQGLLLLVAMPMVWRSTQRHGIQWGLATIGLSVVALGAGAIWSGSAVSWLGAATLVLGLTVLLAVLGYGQYAHGLQIDRTELKHTVSRQRVAASKMRAQDPSTGLANKPTMMLEINRAKSKQARDGHEFLLVMIRSTETNAVQAGQALATLARGYDPIGRVGMGEYAWVVREADMGLAPELKRRIEGQFGRADIGIVQGSVGMNAEVLLAEVSDQVNTRVKAA